MGSLIVIVASALALAGYYQLVTRPAEVRLMAGGFEGSVSLQRTWRADRLAQVVESWRRDGPSRLRLARRCLYVDFGLILLYVVFLLLALRGCARTWPGGELFGLAWLKVEPEFFTGFYLVALAAGLADVAENLCQLGMIRRPVGSGLAAMSYAATCAKWICVLSCGALIALGLLEAILIQRLSG